jgi:hypothetical protein
MRTALSAGLSKNQQSREANMALVGIYKIIETHDLFICLKKLMEKGNPSGGELMLNRRS